MKVTTGKNKSKGYLGNKINKIWCDRLDQGEESTIERIIGQSDQADGGAVLLAGNGGRG